MDIVPLMAVSPREVEQIFYHLIQTAVDAAEGDAEHRLVISSSAAEGHIDLLFSDTCRVVPPGQPLDSVLESSDASLGSGLGLAVVKNIIVGYGGQITVDAGPQSARTFRVRLPVKRIY